MPYRGRRRDKPCVLLGYGKLHVRDAVRNRLDSARVRRNRVCLYDFSAKAVCDCSAQPRVLRCSSDLQPQ